MISSLNNISFEEIASTDCIETLRNQYLDSLIEAQELYLELKLKSSRILLINFGGNQIGYFILDQDNILWEYFVTSDYINQVDLLFGEIIRQFSITKVFCKSFDHTLLSCCVKYHKSVKAFGIHFREYTKKLFPEMGKDIIIRFAKAEDEKIIREINEEIFETDDEIREYIKCKKIFIFEKNNEIIGFGIFSRVIEGRPEFDIGMLVTKKYRLQGYSTYIINYLVEYCQQNGWRPICGCAIENEGSRRSLEKAGFVAGYRLLEFTF